MRLVLTVALRRSRAPLLALVALAFGAIGCARDIVTTTRNIANEGYVIWYPAESGIEPGQIWLYDGTLRTKFADRPEKMAVTSHETHADVSGWNDAKESLSSTFTIQTISKAGPFAAELNAGTVVGGIFRIGPIHSVSIELGPSLLDDASGKYGPGYAKALQLVRDDTPGLLLIAAVIQVPSVEYTFYCDDSFKLLARLPRIRDMLHANIDAVPINQREIRVTMTPIDGMLTFGVTPVRGERLLGTTDQARAILGHDLLIAGRQSYALRTPIPNIISIPEGPIIAASDTAPVVAAKYTQATTPSTQPSTAPSGRVIMPGSATQPSKGR